MRQSVDYDVGLDTVPLNAKSPCLLRDIGVFENYKPNEENSRICVPLPSPLYDTLYVYAVSRDYFTGPSLPMLC